MKLLRRCPVGSIFIASRAFGEIDLNDVRALVEAATDFGFMLAQEIIDELLARIVRNAFRRGT